LEFGFDPETYKFLDNYRRIEADTHNYLGHGKRTGYTAFLQAELRERLAACMEGNSSKKLSVIEQQAFIKSFIDDVHSGNVKRKYIVEFNKAAADGTPGVRRWLASGARDKFPKYADEVPAIAIKGLRAVSATKVTKLLSFLGDSAEFAGKKYLPLIGAIVAYHEARANGNSPAAACTIAGLEEMNPIPVGYSEIHAAGDAYEDAMDWALENNVHGGRAGRIPLDEDGFPIFRKRRKQ
jgi:hypothetical protein